MVLKSWIPEEGEAIDINKYPKAAAAIEEELQGFRGCVAHNKTFLNLIVLIISRELKHLEYIQDYFTKALTILEGYGSCIMCKRGFHQNEIKDYDQMVCRQTSFFF